VKPLRKHVALAIDGGGIKGIMVTRALSLLEQSLGRSVHNIFRLAAGTSTGSIIAAGLGAGLSAERMYALYCQLGKEVFRRTWRSMLWPLSRYRYPHDALERALKTYIGNITMGDFWSSTPSTDVVITVFDLVSKRTRFVKSWKEKYARWPVVTAVLASSSIPTYFPVVNGRYVDGGVGSYANPCYLAAYEAKFCLQWDPDETTLISLGTGRDPHLLQPGDADRFWVWNWISPVLGAFLQSADDQQVRLVNTFFDRLDFRRFQIDLETPIRADDPSKIVILTQYGDILGQKILQDEMDWATTIRSQRI
jgi:predicted acylesterase/phospholipase RssA